MATKPTRASPIPLHHEEEGTITITLPRWILEWLIETKYRYTQLMQKLADTIADKDFIKAYAIVAAFERLETLLLNRSAAFLR